MSNGEGCICNAYGECECACDADWTDQRVYDLQDEVSALRKSKWHNVENILPSQFENVLMYDGYDIAHGYYELHVFEPFCPDMVMHVITHWMPVPDLPLTEEQQIAYDAAFK